MCILHKIDLYFPCTALITHFLCSLSDQNGGNGLNPSSERASLPGHTEVRSVFTYHSRIGCFMCSYETSTASKGPLRSFPTVSCAF